ncbi:MDR family MFS transporter [Undibacterium sp. TJN25]|uniref:MDR family MFS transporter n=1 Tax=Undibacterium sp. TJN25 TaxID=3413056 RepID=UPI003BF3139B
MSTPTPQSVTGSATASGVPATPGIPAAPAATAKEIRVIYFGLMVVMGLGAMDQSIVATALPRIVSDLGGITHLSWVVTAYVLASTSTMPLYGKLSDQYGRKPLLYFAIITFLVGSALCGMAQSLTQLIIFRAIQGIGAGGFLPLTQIIIGDLVPPAQRGRRQGAIAAVFAACSVIGPLLGGVITDLLSWHWIFYVNVPFGAAALAIIARAMRRPHHNHAHRIDYLGSVLLTTCTTAFLLVLALGGTEWAWDSPQVSGVSLLATVLGVIFVWHVRRVPEPVLPLDLFENKLFLIACIVMSLTFMGLLGASIFFPLFFQVVMGVSPAHSGLLTGPLMIGVVISSVVNGRVMARSGRYKPAQVGGLALAVVAFGTLAWGIETAQGFGVIEPAIFLLGLGLGLVMPNMTIAVQNALPATRRGVGTAMLAFFRSLGGLIGVTGSGAILARQLHMNAGNGRAALANISTQSIAALGPQAQAHAISVYRHAIAINFTAGVVIVAVALVALLFLPEIPLAGHPAAAPKPESGN